MLIIHVHAVTSSGPSLHTKPSHHSVNLLRRSRQLRTRALKPLSFPLTILASCTCIFSPVHWAYLQQKGRSYPVQGYLERHTVLYKLCLSCHNLQDKNAKKTTLDATPENFEHNYLSPPSLPSSCRATDAWMRDTAVLFSAEVLSDLAVKMVDQLGTEGKASVKRGS